MIRLKSDQTTRLAGLRRLAQLAFLLSAMIHLLNRDVIFINKAVLSSLPVAYAGSPDQTIQNNNLAQNHRNFHDVQSNDHNRCVGYCHGANDEKKCEETRKVNFRRRQVIEMFRSAKRSFGNGILFNGKGDNKNTLRETTRLVGGANMDLEAEENPQQQDQSLLNSQSDVSPDATNERKPFLENILSKSKRFISSEASDVALQKTLQQSLALMQKISSQAGPSIITILSLVWSNGKRDEISLVTLYTLALLGASCGFHLFLHFITLGYALGVTLPLAVALLFYQKRYELPLPTVLHSTITIFWGVRLFAFLAIREYATWPALHQKVVEVQAKMKIPFASKILCWFLYSFFYLTLVASCWSRLLQSSSSPMNNFGLVGYTGLSLQLVGLSLETIADLQKNSFKSSHRHSWCNVGVWKYSTHPNYLGEGLFWWGTYLAHGFHSPLPSVLATVGLGLILYVLKGSAKSLSSKQKEKYGQEVEFYQFQRTHNVFGPKQMWSRQPVVVSDAPIITESMTQNYDHSVSISKNGNAQEINQ